MQIPALKMNNGQPIPQIGFGLWQVADETECKQAVEYALAAGYRHFDTAQVYGNEQFLGAALKQSSVPREEIFITTKIKVDNFGYKRATKTFGDSLTKLQTDYVDLLLLHFPVPLWRGKTWQALEDIHKAGQAKSIGVSNYTIRHLKQLLKDCRVKPAVNQVELHVFLQQPELLEFCKQHDIVVEAYSPLAHGKALSEPKLAEIAKKHDKTPAQIMLRWCIEQGTVPLPKSVHRDRIEQNIDIFDFTLDDQDKADLGQLESNLRTCWDPTHVP